MSKPTPSHKLSIRIIKPQITTEGEEFSFTYMVKNIGDTIFPGGTITVEIKWPAIDERVFQPVEINGPLSPDSQSPPIKRSQAPMTAGYTTFYIHQAMATDNNPVQVFNSGGGQLWPHQGNFRIILDAVRARTHEEISQKRAVWLAAISLAILVFFEVFSLLLRIFFKISS